jgi:hypothetical protein
MPKLEIKALDIATIKLKTWRYSSQPDITVANLVINAYLTNLKKVENE